ncbi:MAG: Gfo/Idh/MocA family oxidoreductase [Solirubrobacterales bacterium]
MPAAASLRVGLVGCGRIADRGYLPAFRGLDRIVLTAVADPDPARVARLAEAAGAIPAFPSASAMLEAGGIDALVVATPVAAHLEVASLAARAGIVSLVEKPPAPDLAGALALAELDPAPAFGFNRRFLQGHELAPAIPAGGWLELDLELRFRRGAWGAHASRDEALLDAGIHLIDLAAFLAGAAPIAVRDAAVEQERASFELELGRARARIRCATDRPYLERVEVRDRGGRTVATSRTGQLRARIGRLRGGEDPLVASLRRQLRHFAALVRGEQPGELAGPGAAVAALSVVEAAHRSAALGGAEVTVGLPSSGEPPALGRVGEAR